MQHAVVAAEDMTAPRTKFTSTTHRNTFALDAFPVSSENTFLQPKGNGGEPAEAKRFPVYTSRCLAKCSAAPTDERASRTCELNVRVECPAQYFDSDSQSWLLQCLPHLCWVVGEVAS